MNKEVVSSGHMMGQLIGDWWERYVIFPMLQSIATDLGLFADCRYVNRNCRGERILWSDLDGNSVDYDFVLEIGGSKLVKGTPVAFMESFWRRGARHSKDKARDDTNKLLPMRETYPSARFLAIAACGEFTEPARDYVKSRGVALFFIPKSMIVAAFGAAGFNIDYDDGAPESEKSRIASIFQEKLDQEQSALVAGKLKEIVGESAFSGFIHTVVSALIARPVEIKIRQATFSEALIFRSIEEAASFLENPIFENSGAECRYLYSVVYSDGSEFSRDLPNMKSLKMLNKQLLELLSHMEKVNSGLSAHGI